MFGRIREYLQAIFEAFVADDALSRGASISFYTVTSIGPVLFIVVAIAGLAFGEDAARGAISEQLSQRRLHLAEYARGGDDQGDLPPERWTARLSS
jgi:uncharacterized BrkB/YihY/UPF0761 family membrane protein